MCVCVVCVCVSVSVSVSVCVSVSVYTHRETHTHTHTGSISSATSSETTPGGAIRRPAALGRIMTLPKSWRKPGKYLGEGEKDAAAAYIHTI